MLLVLMVGEVDPDVVVAGLRFSEPRSPRNLQVIIILVCLAHDSFCSRSNHYDGVNRTLESELHHGLIMALEGKSFSP